ncbi:bestrophin family protein [Oceanobacter mangrovi]|uniref:bestrophin family protein n=1 Tax=Oceanobacter mangrovi TaxID=2862510 RepID=UPI001C8EB2DD|nr:bestrophin family ion channel [Oceanobacter mangrovi]
MIVRERPNALALMFIWKGSILPAIAPQLAVLAVFSVLVVLLHTDHLANLAQYSIAPFALMGIALSLYLGFRNNACYERWWEGRRQWGSMVADVRSMARSAKILMSAYAAQSLMRWCCVFYHCLRLQLRHGKIDAAELSRQLPEWCQQRIHPELLDRVLVAPNPADAALQQMALVIRNELQQQRLDTQSIRILDEHLARLTAIQAACERLATTPLPFAYTLLTHRTAYLYCFLLPFGLVGSMGWLTPLFTVIVAYTFFGLDALAEQLERPFSTEANGLPLDALCRINDRSIAQAQGLAVPDALQPQQQILL